MTRRPVVLVTGAGGEIGHGLIHQLADLGGLRRPRPRRPGRWTRRSRGAARRPGSGTSSTATCWTVSASEFEISVVFHLAALLSTRAEFVPETAHEVNVQGTLNLLRLAVDEARSLGHPVKFLFPSSIAVYGMPDLDTKRAAGKVAELAWLSPITMYGCNKLYCEHLGRYFARHYRQLAAGRAERRRLPGDPLPRADLRLHGAERRHERLRAGDDPRRGPGTPVRLLRPRGHAHPVHGHARRDHRPAGAAGGAGRSR